MKQSRVFLKGKTIFVGTIISVFVTVIIVYLTGLSSYRKVLDNSIISLSILAITFFGFITIGLYKGLHITDNLSHNLKFTWGESSVLNNSTHLPNAPKFFDFGEGFLEVFVSILLWILIAIIFILILVLLEFVIWASIIAFIALIYWILMRALKLVFIKSSSCKNKFWKSAFYGILYTSLYLGWMYGVIYIAAQF